MSQLQKLLNQLKANAGIQFLTNRQRRAQITIENLWQFPERINLYGEKGTGKTFLGWTLAKKKGLQFFSSPRSFYQSLEKGFCIIDNASVESYDLRDLLAEMQLHSLRKALIITREPNQVGLPTVHLAQPDEEDITIVYHNLSLLEAYALQPRQKGNLWQIIHSTL